MTVELTHHQAKICHMFLELGEDSAGDFAEELPDELSDGPNSDDGWPLRVLNEQRCQAALDAYNEKWTVVSKYDLRLAVFALRRINREEANKPKDPEFDATLARLQEASK